MWLAHLSYSQKQVQLRHRSSVRTTVYISSSLGACSLGFALSTLSPHYIYIYTLEAQRSFARVCYIHSLSPSSLDLNKTALWPLSLSPPSQIRLDPLAGVCRGLKGASFTRSSSPREETHSCRRGPILCPCRSLQHSAGSGGPPTLLPPCLIVRRSDLPPLTSRRSSVISSSKPALLYFPSS